MTINIVKNGDAIPATNGMRQGYSSYSVYKGGTIIGRLSKPFTVWVIRDFRPAGGAQERARTLKEATDKARAIFGTTTSMKAATEKLVNLGFDGPQNGRNDSVVFRSNLYDIFIRKNGSWMVAGMENFDGSNLDTLMVSLNNLRCPPNKKLDI